MDTQSKIQANQRILQVLERQVHMLQQGILPPDLEEPAKMIWLTKEARIVGMLRAKTADIENVKHILEQYETGAIK